MLCGLQVFESLTSSEQLGLMAALGSYHVWSSLGAPDGLHFRLDLTQPEQRDVAREVVKVGGMASVTSGCSHPLRSVALLAGLKLKLLVSVPLAATLQMVDV